MHTYDPPDLMTNMDQTSDSKDVAKKTAAVATPTPAKSVQAREIEQAQADGLLVDLDSFDESQMVVGSPVSVMTDGSAARRRDMDELAQWETNQDEDDSDDDLL